jgi:hypothetical protein
MGAGEFFIGDKDEQREAEQSSPYCFEAKEFRNVTSLYAIMTRIQTVLS